MFSFPQIDPETTGRVTQVPVPFGKYLNTAFDQGYHDSAFNSTMRLTELTLDKADESSPMLDTETANKRYGVGDLKFDEPIREIAAQTMGERKRAEMDRQFILANGSSAARFVPGMAAQVLGGVLNPLDLGLMFLPVVGEERLAAKIAQSGGGALRQALARGLVTREFLEASRVPAPRLLEALIQGAGGQAVFEIPNLAASVQDKANYTIRDSAVNVLGGGLFSGALHLAGSALSKVSRGTKQAMMRDAINQFLRDEDVRVQDYVKVDENVIREQVKFDVIAARADAMHHIGSDMAPIESWARAQLGYDGHLGEVDEHNLVKIAQDWIPLREQQGRDVTIDRRLLDRVLAGERDTVTLQNLASRFDLAFNPMERRLPQIYHLAGGADAREIANALPLKNADRRIQSAALQAERLKQFESLVSKEYDRRINEFVEQKRKEFDPASELYARRQSETVRQQSEGRILPPDQIERYMHQERFNDAEVSAVERDVQTLQEDLTPRAQEVDGKKSLTPEQEALQRELDEALGQVPEPQEQAIRAALDCIINKVA